jgi:hypothetical protein
VALAESASAGLRRRPIGASRDELIDRLADRRGEIEAAVSARIRAVADPGEVTDPAYPEGLDIAVSKAIDFGLEILRASEEHPPPVPLALIAQARLAARNGVGIDTVMRRYLGAYTLLGEFVAREAAELDLSSLVLGQLQRIQAGTLDRLLAAVCDEYKREGQAAPASARQNRLRLVRLLLAGEPVDAAGLRYNLDWDHTGFVAAGPVAEDALRALVAASGCLGLVVCPEPGAAWGWLGGSQSPDPARLLQLAKTATDASARTAIGVGEPAAGVEGWRNTHSQAAAALRVAVLRGDGLARYLDVALLATTLKDGLLAASLKRHYLVPLEQGRDGGRSARETLRAYFSADRQVSSTAAILGVSRTTAGSRLRAIEVTLGRLLSSCAAELELALSLEEVEGQSSI